MKDDVKISVLMTAYNAAPFIGEAIESVLAQSFRDFEFIIINDGSTDGTEDVVRSFKDPRIVLVSQSNSGIAAALNRGLRLARAPYIARFDADDVCYPNRLAEQYQFLRRHPGHLVVGAAADYMDAQGDYVYTYVPPARSTKEIRKMGRTTCPFVHSSVMYRRQAVLQQGGYSEHAHSFEDHLLWRRLVQNGQAINLREPLIRVRLNPASITIDEQWRPKAFHRIKNEVISRKEITEQEGEALHRIIRSQDVPRIKQGAYHSLLAKKYLWNNHQPCKARTHLKKVIGQNRTDMGSRLLYLLSFLPGGWLRFGYRLFKKKGGGRGR